MENVDSLRKQGVFNKILCRDVVLWNLMVSCYALNCLAKEAFGLFKLIWQENLIREGFTSSTLHNLYEILRSSELGKQIHGLIIKLFVDLDVFIDSKLVDMHTNSGNIDHAHKGFDDLAYRNVISWNTMIVGYGQLSNREEAMKLAKRMFQ